MKHRSGHKYLGLSIYNDFFETQMVFKTSRRYTKRYETFCTHKIMTNIYLSSVLISDTFYPLLCVRLSCLVYDSEYVRSSIDFCLNHIILDLET